MKPVVLPPVALPPAITNQKPKGESMTLAEVEAVVRELSATLVAQEQRYFVLLDVLGYVARGESIPSEAARWMRAQMGPKAMAASGFAPFDSPFAKPVPTPAPIARTSGTYAPNLPASDPINQAYKPPEGKTVQDVLDGHHQTMAENYQS